MELRKIEQDRPVVTRPLRIAVFALALILAGSAAWAVFGYLRFSRQLGAYRALIRSLPDIGVSIDESRHTFDMYDALVAPQNAGRPDVLFLNDSTMGLGEDSTAALVAALTGRRVEWASGSGFTPPIYGPILEALIRRRGAPKLVLFQVNPRSFSSCGPFHGIYYEHFRRYLELGDRNAVRDFIDCKIAGNTTAESFYGHRYSRPGQSYGEFFTDWQRRCDARIGGLAGPDGKPAGELTAAYFASYCNPVAPDHPMLAATVDFIKQAKAAGAEVVVYVTPVNVSRGARLLGERFDRDLAGNVAVVGQVVAQAGARFYDFSRLVGDGQFIDRDYANEHTNPQGRAVLAGELAKAISPPPLSEKSAP